MSGGLVLPPGMNPQQPVVLSTPMNDMQVISLMAAVLHTPESDVEADVRQALSIMAEAIRQITNPSAEMMQLRAKAQGSVGKT